MANKRVVDADEARQNEMLLTAGFMVVLLAVDPKRAEAPRETVGTARKLAAALAKEFEGEKR